MTGHGAKILFVILFGIGVSAAAAPRCESIFSEAPAALTFSEARQQVEALPSGNDFGKNPELLNSIVALCEAALREIQVPVAKSDIIKLLRIDALATLTELSQEISVIKSSGPSAHVRTVAKKTLELFALASRNTAIQKAQLKSGLELSRKVAKLDYNVAARDFFKAYKAALEEGQSTEKALDLAGQGRMTKADFEACAL